MINKLIHYILSSPTSIVIGFILAALIFILLSVTKFVLIYIATIVQNKILEKTIIITLILSFILPIIVFSTPIIINLNSTTKNKYGDWKKIYTNDLNADVKLKSTLSSLELTAGKAINTDPEKLNKQWYVKLTIQKNNAEITRYVALNKESFITNSEINKNSKIVNVEYRTIEGYTKSAYGQTGDFIKLKDNGEVRITIEPSEDETKLNELLK